MSTSPKKVEPILCVGPWQNKGPDLSTTFQKTCSTRMKLALQGWSLLCKGKTCSTRMKLALQGWSLLYKDKTCSARIKLALQGWSLLCKDETCSAKKRLAPQGKEAGPHHYKKAPTFSQKVCVTNSSLALWSCKNISDLTFGGCLAGSTPVPLEGVSVLFSLAGNGHERKDRVSHWWTFRHHQKVT